ncbi:MAG TPA: DUF1156 domain-containing protein [Anaerolineae bacterium]|nr:DUF1156 domain-containing protein [Anaerolineae bacterium]
MTITRKKLIEVALPLEAINAALVREKSIRHGHPSTLHLWWARRPLAAARAVIFAQMVDDPSSCPELFPTEKAQEKERQRLFKIIEELVKWENTTNETVLQQARDEIWQSWRRACADNADHPRAKELFDRHKLPAFHDPFAGGGSLPLEAQRLGLEAYASDLNPVAVLINKAMIEIPPRFAGQPPVNPASRQRYLFRQDLQDGQDQARNPSNPVNPVQFPGATGLAEDVRYYGQWMRDEAEKRIGHLYPKVEITAEMARDRPDLKPLVGQKLTVIAWLWARTVKSPNPAFRDVDVPLVTTFMLSTKPGKEAYVEPVIEGHGYRFTVKVGKPKDPKAAAAGTKPAGRGSNFQCIMSGSPMEGAHIKAEGQAGRMGARLMAIVAEGTQGRVYLSPTPETERAAAKAWPEWKPEQDLVGKSADQLPLYGMRQYWQLFTPRQLVALTTFSDLVGEARQRVQHDAVAAGLPDDGRGLEAGGSGAAAYADAVAVYLGLALDKLADRGSTICSWDATRDSLRNTFGRQAIPMVWDFAEGNFLSDASGSFANAVDQGGRVLSELPATSGRGLSAQVDAATQRLSADKLVSTDPPYYDNIGYADLSDFFYVWMRRSLRGLFSDLFETLAVPKADELVATPYRHGSKREAESFFLNGMTQAMRQLAVCAHPEFPVTIYYAFKQSESDCEAGTASTGWETFLEAVIRSGFGLTGTWPMRTELGNRMIGMETNALASSVVMVCRPMPPSAPSATRREFINSLQADLPPALAHLQRANIAPVDLAQAAIGPGMAVYTRYSKVLDASGQPVSVREALALINQVLDETLAAQEGELDADSRWAVAWCEQWGFREGEYGVAETLSKAKNTSVEGLVQAGIVEAGRGKVRLLRPDELDPDWDPVTDKRLTVWQMVHHLIRGLESGGESGAAALAVRLGSKAEDARALAYRLYTISERKKRPSDALRYNALVQSWPEIQRLAAGSEKQETQGRLL